MGKMGTISNVTLCENYIYENFDKLIRENGILRKIYNVTNSIFTYFHRNQNAVQTALWSYLFIELGGVASEIVLTEVEYNLNTCQDSVCRLWEQDGNARNLFSPGIEIRCNSSSPIYSPFDFLEKCTFELCNYAKKMNANLQWCSNFSDYITTETNTDPLNSIPNLWSRLCPKKKFRHNSLIKEATYINSCIINLCSNIDILESTLKASLSNLCENLNTSKMDELLTRLTKVIHEAEKKAEEEVGWTKGNTLASIISSIATITSSVIATIITVITYRIAKSNGGLGNIASILNSLRDVTHGIVQTIERLTASQTLSNPTDIAMNNFISEVRGLTSDVSEILEHSIVYHENVMTVNQAISTNEVEGLGKIQATGIIGAGGTPIKIMLESTAALINIVSTSREEIHSVIQENLTIFSSENQNIRINSKNFIQNFIDDSIFYALENSDIAATQADRLKYSLKIWQNAFCYYFNQLFCRFPLKNHINEIIILVPDNHINTLISKKLPGLCYYILENLWCNWGAFLNILSEKNHTISNGTYCLWDFVTLKIQENTTDHQINHYRIEASGSCYNQTIMIKV